MDRDRTKQLVEHTNKVNKYKKEMELSKNLRKEVEIGEYSSWGEEKNGIKVEFSEGYKRFI